jgi:hypothetical protein
VQVQTRSSAFVCDSFSRATIIVDLTAVAGSPTSFTLDAKMQMSPDDTGTRWIDIPNGAITQITTSPKTEMVFDKPITGAKRVRVVYTLAFVGGTSPTATFEVDLCLSQI